MSLSEDKPPAVLAYSKGQSRLRTRTWLNWILVMGIAAVSIQVLIAEWLSSRRGVESPRVRCQSNLRQIGLGCLMYANASGGRWPDDFPSLLVYQDLSVELFICSNTGDTRAAGPTTQAIAADMAKPGHVSYIYLGKGLVDPVAPNLVVAYEPPTNHGGKSMAVLFADGHVDVLAGKDISVFMTTVSATGSAVVFPPPVK